VRNIIQIISLTVCGCDMKIGKAFQIDQDIQH